MESAYVSSIRSACLHDHMILTFKTSDLSRVQECPPPNTDSVEREEGEAAAAAQKLRSTISFSHRCTDSKREVC